jgi:hypothetical protein
MALSLLIKTLTRALKYRISDIKTIESIAGLLIREANYDMPTVEISVEFKNRDVYRQGRFAGRVNLSAYDKLMEEEDEDDQ